MKRVRILPLKGISRRMQAIVRNGQMEAARVWTLCRDLHLAARREHTPWPGRSEFHQATKGQFALHSQTVQQVFRAFTAAVDATRENRRAGRTEIRYPYRDKRFHPLAWPAQAMGLEQNRIVLPMGREHPSIVLPRPPWLTGKAACEIVWNGVYNELHVTLEVPDLKEEPAIGQTEIHATADLGQIHQAAQATEGGAALIVSGRGIRSLKRLLSKQLGQIARKRSRCKKGSRRWRKLQRARARVSLRTERRVRDLRHKGTRQVIDFCVEEAVTDLFVGNPDGVRTRRAGRHHNQRMSQWEYGRDIEYLKQKAECDRIVCFTGPERGTSSRCPECGHHRRPNGRNWRCPVCGFQGHRDIVGAVNMHPLAFGSAVAFPRRVTYLRPGPLPKRRSGSSSSLDAGQSCLVEARGIKHRSRKGPGSLREQPCPPAVRPEAHPLI